MRILLWNPRERSHFWTFSRALEGAGRKAQDLPLGLLTVAALMPTSTPMRLVDERIRPVTDEDYAFAEGVFLGGLPTQTEGIFRAIRSSKERGKYVVVGGSAIYHRPEEALAAGADVVVVGEAEEAMPELLACLKEGRSGVILRDHDVADMTQSPKPRLDLVDLKDYAQVGIQTTRGCPFLCEFCDVTVMNGRKARTKSVEQILEELEAYYQAGWRRDVFFVDDIFNGNPGRAKAIAQAVFEWQKSRGFPFRFRTQCAMTLAKSTDLLEGMAQAGFTDVFLGIETPDEASNQLTKKFQNVRCDLTDACRTIGEAGLAIYGGCVLGFDNELPLADQRLLELLDSARVPVLSLALLTAPLETDLWKRLESEDRRVWPYSSEATEFEYSPLNFDPTRDVSEIASEFVRLVQNFYEPRAFLDRLEDLFRHMAPAPAAWVPQTMDRGERLAYARVLSKGSAASRSGPDYLKRIRSLSRDIASRMDRFVLILLMYEHLYEYRQGVEAMVEQWLTNRQVDFRRAEASGFPRRHVQVV